MALLHKFDDVSILSTRFLPSAPEMSSIKATLESQKQEVEFLDVSIKNLQAEIERLQERKAILKQSYSVASAILAPIRQLPTEILQYVFLHYIEPKFQFNETKTEGSFSLVDVRHLRLSLASVCRLWNDAVKACPELWTTFVMDDKYVNLTSFKLWLSRAKQCPLDVQLHLVRMNIKSLFRQSDLQELLVSNFPRFRTLIMMGDLGDRDHVTKMFFPPNITQSLPHLEHLRIDAMAGRITEIGKIDAPKLKRLSLKLYGTFLLAGLTPRTFEALEDFRMFRKRNIDRDNDEVLQFCSNIRTLHLHGTLPHSAVLPPSLTYSRLTHLELVLDTRERAVFLSSLNLPALYLFSFDTVFRSQLLDFGDLPLDSWPSLRHLRLTHVRFKEHAHLLKFRSMNNLEILELRSCTFESGCHTLDYLSLDENITVCQRLQVLHLQSVDLNVDIMKNLIVSRNSLRFVKLVCEEDDGDIPAITALAAEHPHLIDLNVTKGYKWGW